MYDDQQSVDMFTTNDIVAARSMMNTIIRDVQAAMTQLTLNGWDAVATVAEPIWNLARSSHWDGDVLVSIHYMEMDTLTHGRIHVDHKWIPNDYQVDNFYDELTRQHYDNDATVYEILARPYEIKYFGERIH